MMAKSMIHLRLIENEAGRDTISFTNPKLFQLNNRTFWALFSIDHKLWMNEPKELLLSCVLRTGNMSLSFKLCVGKEMFDGVASEYIKSLSNFIDWNSTWKRHVKVRGLWRACLRAVPNLSMFKKFEWIST